MSRSLPSLTALRVFEAAGRLQSFSKAAGELNVTQGAVSRQIRALEEDLNVKLFLRSTRRVELTAAGRFYQARIGSAFRQIEQATEKLRAHDIHTMLTVSVLPSVGSFWLMPRLNRFSQRHPSVETRVVSSIDPVDFQSNEADVAIRVGALPGRRYEATAPRVDLVMTTDWRDVEVEELAADVLVPVLSPGLLEGRMGISAAGLLGLPLIHTSSRPHAWMDWARSRGFDDALPDAKEEYGHFFMSLEAARQGLGVALVPDILVDRIDRNELVALTGLKSRSAAEYYLLYLRSRKGEESILKFREWIHEEFHRMASAALPAGVTASGRSGVPSSGSVVP
ncbi:LysR family glycine cleavage system transcriptional activator OS=Castellaniella defragrans OX=75697 GN=HNR28_001162 PE=3 SV=1 [Castellaniella defragrans]